MVNNKLLRVVKTYTYFKVLLINKDLVVSLQANYLSKNNK